MRKDGSIFPVLVNTTANRDAMGNFISSRSSVIDITDRVCYLKRSVWQSTGRATIQAKVNFYLT